METILEFLKTDTFLLIICGINILLLVLYIINIIKLHILRKNYLGFMKKVGEGENLQKTLEKYMDRVGNVEKENTKIQSYCKELDNNISTCLQKVGIVRYSAFKDTGSDLSFTLALLDEKNTGVVLNGIYSREMSNIYAKPVEKGESSYTLSNEEKEAINKAINS